MPSIGNRVSERRMTNTVIYIILQWCEQNGYTHEYDIKANA